MTNKTPPARSPLAREQELTSLAYDRAEQQLIEGDISAQVLTHFLKAGSYRQQLEDQKLMYETKLLEAREAQIRQQEETQAMFAVAIAAMKTYTGADPDALDAAREEYGVEEELY